jgi:phage N-6-adenine-methyltransferase
MSHWESKGKSDEWYTPKYIFDALGVVFDMDVAASDDRTHCHVPAKDFITQSSESKNGVWKGFVWCNPPFGGRNSIADWLDNMRLHRNGIALTPDRTSAPWWQEAASQADAILFIKGKVKFIRPDGSVGKSPSNGTTLLAYGIKGTFALHHANKNNLGTLMIHP